MRIEVLFMPRRTSMQVCLALLLILFPGLVSCERLPTSVPLRPTLAVESLSSPDSIPAEYGNLVSVTVSSPFDAQLWFEKPDRTIVLVRINYASGGLGSSALVIPRK